MEITHTIEQYDTVIESCRDLFLKKTKDYGTAWRILRTKSLTDQIFIKANRIRTIEEMEGVSKIDESVESEYIGIINYCVMSLIQLDDSLGDDLSISVDRVTALYDTNVDATKQLMINKNHDYGEAWRDMRISSMTDLILMKIIRIKSIEDNDGITLVSEGLAANYMDILNYAVFAMIKLNEAK